ncbi:MAG TPA: NAD(P)/FAD-dependent oxidoreductase [Nevskiaceae bacterium]|nr:NAD(P)/FAD-dependent oxidoreductase [Nevskiaceae bacterium]
MKRAIVIGSGLAGLSAAYRLHRAGWDVTVLERSDRLCGRVITFRKGDYTIDGCATSISSHYTRYIALMREIGLGDRLTDASNVFGMVRNGAAYYVDGTTPIRSFLGTKILSPAEKVRFTAGALKLKKYMTGVSLADPGPSVAYDHLSIREVVEDCFGAALTDTFMDPVMRVVTFGDVGNTTSVEFFTGLVSATGHYMNVLGGLETLPQALARKVRVKLASPAKRIERRGTRAEVTYLDAATGAEATEPVDACVVTCTFPQAVALDPALGVAGPALAARHESADAYVVHLGYASATRTNPAAIALPRREFPLNPGIFLDHNKAPDRAPKGHSLFTLYYCPEAVPVVKGWTEAATIENARSVIERFFPEVRGSLDMANVKYAPYGSHLAPPGHFKAVGEFFANHPASDPVQVGGDYFSLPSQETAVAWGERAAARVLDGMASRSATRASAKRPAEEAVT